MLSKSLSWMPGLSGPAVPPDQDLLCPAFEEIRTSPITVTGQTAVRSPDRSSQRVIEGAVLVTALRRDIVDGPTVVLVLEDGLRWISDRLGLETLDQRHDPIRMCRLKRRSLRTPDREQTTKE
jgi:hypothetical protein